MKMNGSDNVDGISFAKVWRRVMARLGLVLSARTDSETLRVALNQGAFYQFAGRRFSEAQCLQGVLWITESGREDDLMLKAGQQQALTGHGQVLVQALAPSLVLLRT